MSDRSQLIFKINAEVNQFPYDTDLSVWHQPEYWERISKQARGDCEDFVMEKRWRLFEAGVPFSDIRIATCIDGQGVNHAVLVVADPEEGGDWILDNEQPMILTEDDVRGLGYKGVSIQKPNHWLWEEWKI